jgi:hypothetical protein
VKARRPSRPLSPPPRCPPLTRPQAERLEASIKEAHAATDKVQKEYNALSEKVVKLHHDLEEAVHHNSQLLADNGARQVRGRTPARNVARGFGYQVGGSCPGRARQSNRGRGRGVNK